MAKTVTLRDVETEEALYPKTKPENVIDENGNNVLELIETATKLVARYDAEEEAIVFPMTNQTVYDPTDESIAILL